MEKSEKSISLMPFRLGSVASEPVIDTFLVFYKWIAETVDGNSCILPPKVNTIPFTNDTISNGSSEMYDIVLRQYYENKNANKNNIFIIDLSYPRGEILRGGVTYSLAQAIQASYHHNNQDKDTKLQFILLLDNLPPQPDPVFTILEQYIDAGQVVLIDNDGNTLPQGRIDGSQYKSKWIELLGTPLELLKIKMIRRLGHFCRHGKCVRFFYDGSLCIDEIGKLIRSHMEETYSEDAKPIVFYDAVESKWLTDAVSSLSNDYIIENINNISKFRTEINATHPLLIVPMIDTGVTLKKLIKSILEYTSHKPNILAILSTSFHNNSAKVRNLVAYPFSGSVMLLKQAWLLYIHPNDTCLTN